MGRDGERGMMLIKKGRYDKGRGGGDGGGGGG
jgi:hypothetical protein